VPRTRVNNHIRVREVRVVGANGTQIGVMETREAIKLAQQHGLDLVEIAGSAKPPVCKICDFGKFKYDESKKNKENKKSAHVHKTKEIQLRPRCEQHDFDFKLARAIDFLCQEMKVKVYLRFRGRENAHKDLGFDAVQRFLDELEAFGKADTKPRLAGRGITCLIQPLSKHQRAKNPRANSAEEQASLEDESHDGSESDSESEGDLNNAFENLEVPEEKQNS
jgi:translation initiation factor IF-3